MGSSAFLVVNVEELELFTDGGVLGDLKEDFLVFSGLNITEVGNGELSVSDLSLKVFAGDFSGGGSNSLENPVDNIVLNSTTGVFLLLTVPINER